MPPQQRYAHIDSLRAVAALLVVWTHAAEMFAPLAGGSWLLDVALRYNFGRIGVVAFFGVSGFLIPTSLKADGPRPGRTFLIRRFFRLFPAFWLSIPLGVLAIWALFGKPIGAADVALNFTMVPDLIGAQPVMGSYWTLEYELAFYGLCLLAFKTGLLDRRYLAAGVTAGLLGAYAVGFAAMVVTGRQHYADLGVISLNFSCLFLGALWRRALDGRLDLIEKLAVAAALALFWIVTPAACAYAIYGHGSDNPFYVQFPVSYGAGVALFIALTSFAKVRWRPLAWIGAVSYSLYLLHPVATYTMRYAFERHAPGTGLPVGTQMLIAVALSTALAAAAFYGLERPAIAWGRRFTDRPRDRAAAGATADAHAAP
jgi:peptidoglycan/LPS O-acetylase OafA/YrhL